VVTFLQNFVVFFSQMFLIQRNYLISIDILTYCTVIQAPCCLFSLVICILRFSRRTMLRGISQSVMCLCILFLKCVCCCCSVNDYIYEICQLSIKFLENVFLIPFSMLAGTHAHTCTCAKRVCGCPRTASRTIQEAAIGWAFNPTEENSICT
jgi:hypothetical protein